MKWQIKTIQIRIYHHFLPCCEIFRVFMVCEKCVMEIVMEEIVIKQVKQKVMFVFELCWQNRKSCLRKKRNVFNFLTENHHTIQAGGSLWKLGFSVRISMTKAFMKAEKMQRTAWEERKKRLNRCPGFKNFTFC